MLTAVSWGMLDVLIQQLTNVAVGKHSVTIPASLPAGQYLLRAEIVGLHAIYPSNDGRSANVFFQIALHVAQSYPGAQFVSSIYWFGIALVLESSSTHLHNSTSVITAGIFAFGWY